MSAEIPYTEKELSWLSFNERVLQEAADPDVPLIERLRFLGIFSSNLDEFYKVRFADVKRRILISQENQNIENPKHLLSKMQSKVLRLNEKFELLYTDLIEAMRQRRIFLADETEITDYQKKWVHKYFHKEVMPHITPLLMNKDTDVLNFLRDGHTYLAVELIHSMPLPSNEEEADESQPEEYTDSHFALVDIPTHHLPRFIMIPEQKGKRRKTLMMLDDIIRACIDDLFNGFFEYSELNCFSMTMTRDAEYDLRHEVEHSLLEQMSEGVSQRLKAMPVRFVYQSDMPDSLLSYLCDKLNMSNYDSLIPGGRYHNFKDFIGFPNVGRSYLENPELPPMKCADFEHYPNSFKAIRAQDILLYYPYHTFDHITELVRQAAFDPKVIAIKINIYRVAKNSKLMNSLMDAVHNKKKVTVVVELQARFDEEANIEWAKLLTDAGVHVIFGSPGLKIHSKLLLISRKESEEIRRYAHIGTGNFHEKTARIYTDFTLLTADPALTEEVRNVFNYIENPYRPVKFEQLMVSPYNSRQKIYEFIDDEIAIAQQGKKASLTIKVNNLVDKELISKLYEANNAGVKIRMIVRGMCALVPGIPNFSEHIKIISVIDRFLEHPRVFVSGNDGDPKVYISSADWMTRNLDYRIEVATPIHSERLKKRIIDILEIHFVDTVKARIIDKEMNNHYVKRGNRKKIRSQIEIYDYLKQVEKKARKTDPNLDAS